MNQILNFNRLMNLARRDLINGWRGTAIASGVVSGAIFVIAFLGALFEGQRTIDYNAFFTGTMVIWGTIAASLAFDELHDKEKNDAYLLLPASSVEKTLISLFSVSVMLPLLILILITAASLVTEGVTALVFRLPYSPFNPLFGDNWSLIGKVIIIQSIFFLGASWFKKAHWIKTVLTVIVGSIVMGILASIIFRILFGSYFEGFFTPKSVNIDFESLMRMRFPKFMDILSTLGKTALYGLLAPFCWFVAWLRVKETQSSDGV